MPSLKDLFPELVTDYLDGFDIEGVEVPADVMKRIYERISPDELTPKQLLNECFAFGLLKRDEDSCLKEWAREDAVLNGIKSGEVRSKNAQDLYREWQEIADIKWRRAPGLSKPEIAEYIVEGQKTDYEYDETVKIYSVDYVRRKIKKR